MHTWIMAVLFLFASGPVFALSEPAREFMAINEKLEPVQCEKRKLRRELALAEVERRDADVRALRERFAALDRDPQTAKLERRLAELQPRLERSSDPEDLRAINQQRVEAFYRCD
jgi:predicted nuclease with TOPRIM domain